MAQTANNLSPVEDEDQFQEETLRERFMTWVRTELVWYAGSFSFHLLGLSVLLLLPNFGGGHDQGDTPMLVSSSNENGDVAKKENWEFKRTDLGDLDPIQLPEFKVDPTLKAFVPQAQKAEINDNSPDFKPRGLGDPKGTPGVPGLMSAGLGAVAFGHGPKLTGPIGIGASLGRPDGNGLGGLGRGHRDEIKGGKDYTIPSEHAVNAALVWLANHQLYEGNWSLQHYVDRCIDKTCTGTGEAVADAGATAMGLLPFLAAGQTHLSKGPYKEHIRKGLDWLIRHQQSDGNLAKGAAQMMYSHGLATIALCEAYEMTGDRRVGMAAQGAVNFILNAQNTADGGWRYNPKDPGDTSVVGWQLMALKSAQMAKLDVGGSVFSGTSKWLDSVAVHDGTEYAYQPLQGPSPAMTSVGLLCRQYLGAKRDNPMLTGGMAYLLQHLPDEGVSPNIYYWYYATQVMHNMGGYYRHEWETWNRRMRDLLVHSQVRGTSSCANGSWPPERDAWGRQGGRLMTTSLSCLTLEVYYRFLPLFKSEAGDGEGGGEKQAQPAKKAASDKSDLL